MSDTFRKIPLHAMAFVALVASPPAQARQADAGGAEQKAAAAKVAQERSDANLHRVWAVTPKADAGSAFVEAVKAHLRWRLENKDPWQWGLYVADSGKIDGTVYLRSGGHTHADIDAYAESEFAAKAGKHWEETVHPHVAGYTASMSRSDAELAHWPEDDYRIYSVTRFHLKVGHGAAFRACLLDIQAKLKAAGRKSVHSWNWALTGEHLPTISLVVARKDWKGFDSPEESVMDVLSESLGPAQAAAIMDTLYSHVDRISADVYRRIRDLSGE